VAKEGLNNIDPMAANIKTSIINIVFDGDAESIQY
jgi:hypothetical protein